MKIILPFLFSISLYLTFNSVSAQEQVPGFAVHHSSSDPVASVSKINCSISNGRALLKWNIINNQAANQFEVESSSDGKNFHMAALVFGTDKADTDEYVFFEKAKNKKTYYRVKIINKDQSVQYSDIVSP